jgi:hypothetical protein
VSGTSTQPPCGFCEGVSKQTPGLVTNRPGLPQIGYRVGTYANFKASLLAALSDPANSPLGLLTTRDDGDFTIALLDAFAVAADILTFYQERLANESYLRTASLPRSVFELARLVDYQPSPGVAATAQLAVTLNNAVGAPDPAVIPAGTPVQSVPAAGQSAAIYETSFDLTAWIEHNALPPQTTVPLDWSQVTSVTPYLWLSGTSTGLKPGDALLFVEQSAFSANFWAPSAWCQLTSVTIDAPGARTLVRWSVLTLGTPAPFLSSSVVSVYAMRRRASLYGATAPDPNMLSVATVPFIQGSPVAPNPASPPQPPFNDWNFIYNYFFAREVVLDSLYTVSPGLAPNGFVPPPTPVDPSQVSWLVLSAPNTVMVVPIAGVDEVSMRAFGLSGKATRLTLDWNVLGNFPDLQSLVAETRTTIALIQSELLTVAPSPLLPADSLTYQPWMLEPVSGNSVTLVGGSRIVAGQSVGVSGQLVRLQLVPSATAQFSPASGSLTLSPSGGDIFLLNAPYDPTKPNRWNVLALNGIAGTLAAAPAQVTLQPAAKSDPVFSEIAVLAPEPPAVSGSLTTLTFVSPLTHIYDRGTFSVNANIVTATQGSTVTEVLGSGAAVSGQTFQLRQSPLTYVPVASGQGAQSTLQVFVNDLQWQQTPNFIGAKSADRVYIANAAPGGTVTIQFGDGRSGARPPTGQMNVRARYRVGIGMAGMVQTGQLSQPIIRPPGLKTLVNPSAASGGADPDCPDNARQSAPLHTLTLDRVVSLADYQNYALAFAGIAKAAATWSWFNQTRGVSVTVAGAGGSSLAGSSTLQALATSILAAGDPYVPIQVLACQTTLFQVAASVLINTPTYDGPTVIAAVGASLTSGFGFSARAIGQGVAQSDVIAAITAVAGVLAVRLTVFGPSPGATLDDDGLPVFLPVPVSPPGANGVPGPAGLLLLDTSSLGRNLTVWQ